MGEQQEASRWLFISPSRDPGVVQLPPFSLKPGALDAYTDHPLHQQLDSASHSPSAYGGLLDHWVQGVMPFDASRHLGPIDESEFQLLG